MKYVLLFFLSGACAQASLFPENYESSRSRFRESCQRVAANIKGKCGIFHMPADQDLTIDYGVFTTADAKKLLIIVSGNHGPETYSGAAAQELLMQSYMPMFAKAGIDVVLVHALNPYGFKFNRRTDKDNVNLNRNFGINAQLFQTKNEYYDKFRTIWEPEGPVGGAWDSIKLRVKMVWNLLLNGFNTKIFAQGMNSGQYQYQKGFSFGGFQFQPQVQFLDNLLRPMLPKYKDVLFLDFHTGLGEKETLHIMKGERIKEESLKQAQEIFKFNASADGIVFTSGQDKGFYPTTGDLIDFIPQIAPAETNVMALVFEFGTVGKSLLTNMKSAALVIMENQAGQYQCVDPNYCKELRANFLEHFNPSSEEWRSQFLDKTNKVYSAIISKF